MTDINQLEEFLAEQDARPIANINVVVRERVVAPRLTLERQLIRDENRTIPIRTGLTEQEFHYVLSLLQEEPQPIIRGGELLYLDIRLVVFLQWLRTGFSYKAFGESFKLH